MRRAIREYLLTAVTIVVIIVVSSGVAVYILDQQRLRFPLVEDEPFRVRVVLSEARAVQPGRGQAAVVAGVKVGAIGDVKLEDGRAVVTLELDPEYEGLVRKDATVLLRTKTALKDMFVEIQSGRGRPLDDGDAIPVSRTLPDIDPDEIISSIDILDADTRDYLKLLVSGAGKGVAGRGGELRGTLRTVGPLQRALAGVTGAIAERRRNLRRLVNRYALLTRELGRSDRDLVRLVRTGGEAFGALAAEEPSLERSVAELPGALRATEDALAGAGALGRELSPTVTALRPAVRRLAPVARALTPLAREGAPVLRDSVRPFARIAGPEITRLGAGAGRLAKAGPDVTESLGRVNRLLNLVAFNPGGAERLTGDLARDRARQEGYLYWLAWTAQNSVSLLGTADGLGVVRRITLGGVSCTALGVPAPIADSLAAAGLCVEGAP